MKKLKKGRIIAGSLIAVLLVAIVAIIKISSIDRYAGLVKINNALLSSVSTKLSANISDLSEDNNITVKGYDEIDYNISYTLSEAIGQRDVIINAKLDDNDIYTSFKEVTGANITSVLSANRKEITITISNLPSGQTINSKVTMIIENAPNGYEVRPTVRIKESTGDDYTNVTVKPVTVSTSSVQGTVVDTEGNAASNLLIALKKDGQIVKETYTNSNGFYVLSDITPDTYSIIVNQDNYENLELNNQYIQNGNLLNLVVKKVYPYSIETNKYITKVELNNLGSSKDYLYNDVKLAQIPVKKVNDLHGKIYYKITVQNTGEKAGIIAAVKDELPEGLSFDESLNSGYELKNGIIYNRNLEGVELSAGEMISDTLVLTIENTDVAKTYINKVNAKGELYEHVVYLIDGRTYKTLDVLEGETIDEPTVSIANFNGWYTDEKLTNKYKFELPVEKDLILYGVTQAKHTVTFNDKHPETLTVTEYDRKTVNNGDPVSRPNEDPSKTGYDFCGWVNDSNVEWDFNTPVTSDLTLTSKYCIKSYDVEFYDKSASNGAEYAKILTLSKEYKTTVTNSEAPDLSNEWAGHNFLRWTTDPDGQSEYDFTSLITGPVKLYAQYSLQERSFIFNDENRITEKTVDYGATVNPIDNQGKEGHTFKYWSESLDGEPYNFSTPIFVTTTVYAVYQINTYNVIFNDTDPWTNQTTEYDNQTVDHGDKATEPAEPSKEGHTFCGWLLNGTSYDFDTRVTDDITLESCYTKNKVLVTFMDGNDQFATEQVDYADYAHDTDTHPTKEHNVFKFWTEDGTTAFNFTETQIKTPKTLYSTYEEVTTPTITHTPLYWTNDKVLVTITSDNPNYSYVYKVDDGTYQNYIEPFELETNSTITAKSVYNEVESVITTHEVTNIDKLNPTIGTITPASTPYTITLVGTMTDNQSGVKDIKVFANNIISGTENGTPVNIDLKDYEKSKDISMVISGLTPNTEYSIKVEVTDGAGNISTETFNVTTASLEPICQIISIDGVDLNPEDYIPFPLLELAIEDTNCTSKCTIQMLKGTTESVEILDTQDITLDLNGKTVAGVLPGYTVNNQGEFTLIDHASEAGGLINNSGIAILNNANAKLTLGEGSSEEPTGSETRVVSTTVPYVFGENYGIYSERGADFSFFDGKVKGTNAIQGRVTETEYLYSATSADDDPYEEVTLAILTDPEARLNKSIYYGNAANAALDAQGGTLTPTASNATFLSGFTHVDEVEYAQQYSRTTAGYPFVYDETTDTLTSGNQFYGSMAFTETIIDLTDAENDQVFEIEYHVVPNADGSYGTANLSVLELLDNMIEPDDNSYTSNKLYPIYSSGDLKAYRLTKGSKYKVKFSFLQPISMQMADFVQNADGTYTVTEYSQVPESKLVVTKASLHVEERTVNNGTEIQGNAGSYGFYYDETTNTIRSNTQFINDRGQTNAYGYTEIDLSDKTGEYIISVTASSEAHNYSQVMFYMSENQPNFQQWSTSSGTFLYWSTYGSSYDTYEEDTGYSTKFQKVGPVVGSQTLQGGKKYYLNYNFFKGTSDATQEEFDQYNITDQLIINNINVYKTGNSEDLDITTEMVGNAFDFTTTYNDGGYSLPYQNFSDYHDSYIKIDLTNSEVDKVLELDSHFNSYHIGTLYITSNNRGLTVEELKNNRQKAITVKDDLYATGNFYYKSGTNSNTYGTYDDNAQDYLLEKGNVYYVHYNLRKGPSMSGYQDNGYDCYSDYGYCGTPIKGMKLRDVTELVYTFGNTPINVGTVDNNYGTEESTTITLTDRSVTPVINTTLNTGYVYDSSRGMYVLEKEIPYYNAAAWIGVIDLTSETETKTFEYVYDRDQTGNLSWYDYYTVDQLYPLTYNNSGGPLRPENYVDYSPYNSYLTLEPGHKYYLYHMVYRNSSSSINGDAFKFEEVTGDRKNEYKKLEKVVSFNEDVDEIQILKNIELKNSFLVDYNKETILDLNGYTISSTLSDAVIVNNGKLTIIDSDYEEQTGDNKTHNGIIESSGGNLINNGKDAELIIKNAVLKVNNGINGIYNEGSVLFAQDYDSKIYVNSYRATGIYNTKTGRIQDTGNSIEIVMNYNNQASYNYSLYNNLRNTYGDYYGNHINIGIYNEGFINSYGLKITGKNGTGFWNTYEATAVIRYSQIDVDINNYDKNLYHDDYSVYNYQYYWREWNSWMGQYYDYYETIVDYSIKNEGTMSIFDGSVIGHRIRNEKDLYFGSGATSSEYLYNGSKLDVFSGGSIYNLCNMGDIMSESSQYYATIENYKDIQFKYGSASASTINNHGSGTVKSYYNSLGIVNNYDQGDIVMNYSGASHIFNEGTVSMTYSSVNADPDVYEENIKNSGTLNLNYSVTIGNSGNPTKYGIFMVPKTTKENKSIYDYPTRQSYYYDEYTYRQTKINIGTPDSENLNITITGKEYGVTGPCYYNAEHKLFGTSKAYTRYMERYDGTKEPLIQTDYDQNLCDVNLYEGKIGSTDYPNTYSRAIAVPIKETTADSLAYWDSGLVVANKNYLPSGYRIPATIGSTEYLTLQDAIDSVPAGTPTTIDVHWFYSVGTTVIPEGKDITLNLEDGVNSVLYSYDGGLENNGILKITGTGSLYSFGKYVVDNNSNFTINNGNFYNNWSYRKMERSLVNNKGTTVINNANLNQMDLYNQGNLTINDGDYNGTMIYGNGENSVTTVTGGFFETSSSAVATYHGFKTSYTTAIDNKEIRHIFELFNKATAVIDGLNTTSDTRYTTFRPIVHLSDSTIEFKNSVIGDISGDNSMRFISAEGESNIIFDSGIYKNIYIDNDGSHLTVNAGNLSGYTSDTDGAFNLVYMHGSHPTADIVQGVLEGPNHVLGLSDFTGGYSVTIGTKGDLDENDEIICSKTNPSLIAEQFAVAKYGSGSGTGFFGFYDGILKGKGAAIDINVDEIEDDFEIIDDTESPYFVKYLDQKDLVKNVTTGAIYKSFSRAFSEATNGDVLETLRTYTNTKTTSPITIPATSNFTLKIKHLITVNNPEFIINNGNATFESAGAGIFSNVSSNIFVNNATLNLNSLNINNLKGDGSKPELLLNNETGTLNINGSSLETVQHTFVTNHGTLNISKVGTDECYDTTRFKITYVPGDAPVDVAIKNYGTANIDYLVLVSEYYDKLVLNYGDMVINHSTFDQTSDLSDFTPPNNYYEGSNYKYMILNQKNLEIKNSNLLFIPKKTGQNGGYGIGSGRYANYMESAYIINTYSEEGNNAVLVLDNNNMELSFFGIVKAFGTSRNDKIAHNFITIKNSNVNSISYGVIGKGVVNIDLKDNIFNIRDSIVDGPRSMTSGYYMESARLYFYAPEFNADHADLETLDENSIINIDGGVYNTSAAYHLGGEYTSNTVSYPTTCSNSSMQTTSINRTISYTGTVIFNVSGIASSGTLNINDATINIVDFTRNSTTSPYIEYTAPYRNFRDKYEDEVEHSGEITGYTVHNNWLGVITSFGTTTITNSELNAEASFSDGSNGITLYKGYGDKAILIIGEKDNNNDSSTPLLTTRSRYPMSFYQNMGGIKLYDGLIRTTDVDGILLEGNANDMDKHFIDKEDGYVITGTRKTRYLTQENIVKNVTQDVGYTNIQTAIDAANNGDELQLLGSTIRMSAADDLVVNNKRLTIDINCFTVSNNIDISNGGDLTMYSGACSAESGTALPGISTINVNDTSKLSISKGADGVINAYDSSTVTLSGSVSLDVNGYDTSSVTFQNNTKVNYWVVNHVTMNDQSSLTLNDGKISSLNLNDDTTLTTTCSSDSATVIDSFYNSELRTSVPITLSCGTYNFKNYGEITFTGGIFRDGANYGTMTLDGATVPQGNYISNYNVLYVLSGDVNAFNNYKTATVSGGSLRGINASGLPTYGYNSTLNITGGTIGSLYHSSSDDEKYYSADITITGGTIESAEIVEDMTVHALGGTYTTVNVRKYGLLYIGSKDGNVDGTSPVIDASLKYSSNMAGLTIDTGGDVRFYDGYVKGFTSKGAIVGRVSDTEDDYKVSVIDNGDGTEAAYLTPITVDDSKIAMVNGINYSSLQQAVNKAVLNTVDGVTPNVTIYHNIELDADLTVASGYTVNIISNGYTISTNNHTVDPNILLDGEPITDSSLGGDIVNSLRNALGLNPNTKDVLIYEMSDGSTLSSENHYRLYEYNGSDYELVTLDRGSEVARYTPGRGITNMKPIKGRLYLIDLEPGNYKVTDDNGSEVTFTINDDLTLSGHVKEYVSSNNNIEANGEAKLLISIQTGIRKVNYLFIAMSIIVILSVMFILQKKKNQTNKNLV